MKAMEFTVTHVIPATPQELSDAWLDGDSPRGPWLGDGARRIDPVVGGAYYWVDLEGEKSPPHYGRFLRIERPRLIEYTFMSEFTHGLDSIVTVEPARRQGWARSQESLDWHPRQCRRAFFRQLHQRTIGGE